MGIIPNLIAYEEIHFKSPMAWKFRTTHGSASIVHWTDERAVLDRKRGAVGAALGRDSLWCVQ